MLLTIHNLPPDIRYQDIKVLIQSKCGVTDVILDNLVNEGNNKKVTVGLADDSDAAILARKINGLFVSGQQLYVENIRQKKASEQPYRSSRTFHQKSQNEMFIDPLESTYSKTAFGQITIIKDATYNSASHGMYDSSQEMYDPNGQVKWDQAAMMGNSMGGMGSMGNVGSMMYMPSMMVQTPFMGFGSQMQSSAAEGLASRGMGIPNNKRDWGTSRAVGLPKTPLLDLPASRGQLARHNLEPARSRWDEIMDTSRMALATQKRAKRTPPSKKWPLGRPIAQESYDSYSEDIQRHQEPSFGQARNAFEPDPPTDTGPLMDSRRAVPERRRPIISPWETPNSFAPQNLIEDREESSLDYMMDRRDRAPLMDRFDEPTPWQLNSLDVQRPTRQNLRFDSTHALPARTSRFDDPEPRPNQRQFGRQTHWANPPEERTKPLSFQRPYVPEPRYGARNGSADADRESFVPKRKQSGRDRDEPPNKRFAKVAHSGPKSFKGPATQQPGQGNAPTKGPAAFAKREQAGGAFYKPPQNAHAAAPKEYKPPPPKNWTTVLHRDITWRGQAASEIAKNMLKKLKIDTTGPRDRALLALKRSIRTRIEVLLGCSKSVPMVEIVKLYRQKFGYANDREFFAAVLKSVKEEEKESVQASGSKPSAEDDPSDEDSSVQVPKIKAQATKKKAPVKKTAPKQNSAPANQNVDPQTETEAPGTSRLPKYPNGDKAEYKNQKQAQKLEMEVNDLYELDPITLKALDDHAGELCDLFMEEAECENPEDDQERAVCERISDHASDEFIKVVRLLVTKRLLNVTTTLLVRVHFSHKPPPRTALDAFLNKFGALGLKKSAKKHMYVVTCNSYENYDALCSIQTAEVEGVSLTFKPLYLTGPGAKLTYAEIVQQRKKCIQSQIGKGEFLSKVEFPAYEDIPKNLRTSQADAPEDKPTQDESQPEQNSENATDGNSESVQDESGGANDATESAIENAEENEPTGKENEAAGNENEETGNENEGTGNDNELAGNDNEELTEEYQQFASSIAEFVDENIDDLVDCVKDDDILEEW